MIQLFFATQQKKCNSWDMRNDSADFSVARSSRMQQMWSVVETCRASYLVSLFKATKEQKENMVCLKWRGQRKLSATAGRQYSHYEMEES